MPCDFLAQQHVLLMQDLILSLSLWDADLKFTTSSRMKPRWLVIAAVLPTQDVMYVQYNVPTIVMSRACDQLTKVSTQTTSLTKAAHVIFISCVQGFACCCIP